MSERWRQGFGAAILLLLLVANVAVTERVLTGPHAGHNDFLSRWEGARSFWREGLNPYGAEASLNIQQRIYGREALPDEDPGLFAYPFFTVFVIWPLVYLSYAWASAVWMVLLEVCLVAALLMLLDLYGWRPRPLTLAGLLITTLLCYFPARGLILGQPGLLVYFLEVLTLWALARRQDRAAGVALALSTIKPQMGFLLVPFLLLWGWRARRWQFVSAFGVAGAILLLASFALQPSWLADWIDQLQQYPSYTAIGAPVWIITRHLVDLGPVVEGVVTATLYVVLLAAWTAVLVAGRGERMEWTVMLTLTVTHLAAVRTATPHFVVFSMPLVFYLQHLARTRRGRYWLAAVLALLVILPWVQFLLTVEGKFEDASMYLPVPIGMLLLLWLTRRMWWRAGGFLGGTGHAQRAPRPQR